MSNWQPSCSIETLKARAELYVQIREFFAGKNVLEVETPLLMQHGVTDRYMQSMQVHGVYSSPGFLQTSPEYAMKRLLAAGSGSIYQIGKAFRLEESGARHNPEFTMLEWYRVDFDHWALMDETFELLVKVLGQRQRVNYSYQEAFKVFLNINPFTISLEQLKILSEKTLGELPDNLEPDDYLSLLFEDQIEPKLGTENTITFIIDFPASQSALAKIDPKNPKVAQRFEVYIEGFELANGFNELQDSGEQLERFKADNAWRKANGLEEVDIDTNFIQGLESGLPQCAGIALGLDRLLMIHLNLKHIKQVLAFPAH
ncbi:EF-P lysine aminoacylase EpmA [Kangiella sp. HZ709]|uniref:EF-P lysine aminoacylase EpmA n=1 Tax=Kangiella sp. HZ709 TaxID=2666328 RepID=UPI0012AFEDF1|nr:EF-P lysine aminoacylase EpmA [Kangiella sp. HZ709]MRX28527.1 EF-P lysine aminoacylase GenX [Kangiella sp. HZ709]